MARGEDAADRDDAAPTSKAPKSEASGSPGPERTGSGPADEAGKPTPVTQQLGRVAVVVLLIIFVVFALDNAQHVGFSWLVGGTQVETVGSERVDGGVRLIVLLLAAFGIGALVGGTAVGVRSRAKRKAAARN